jgi:hypothetical protein
MDAGRLLTMRGRLARLGTTTSQFANVLLFDGHPDESVSARAYRQGVLGGHPGWNRARKVLDKVFFWEPDHCAKSHKEDLYFAFSIMRTQKKRF